MNRRSFIGLGGGVISTGIAFRLSMLSASARGAGRPASRFHSRDLRREDPRLRRPGRAHLQGCAVWRIHRGCGALPAPVNTSSLDRRARRDRLGPRAPQPFRRIVPEIGDALVGSRTHQRGVSASQRMDASAGPQQPASRDGLVAWWRLPCRLRQFRLLQRPGAGSSARRGRGDGGAPARRAGISVPRGNRRGEVQPIRQRRHAGYLLALESVRDDVDSFGGNPGSVTVFGRSSSDGKTAILNGMPAAQACSMARSSEAPYGTRRSNARTTRGVRCDRADALAPWTGGDPARRAPAECRPSA